MKPTVDEEVDHLPVPAEEEPPFFDLRRRKRSIWFGQPHYSDAMRAFNVSKKFLSGIIHFQFH